MAVTKPKKEMKIRTEEDARVQLAALVGTQEWIQKQMDKHGISDAILLVEREKKKLTEWAIENDVERIDATGFHGTMISQAYDSRFLATEGDVREYDEQNRKLRSMRQIIRKKFGAYTKGSKSSEIWKRITKPVVVKEAVEELVAEGLLTVKEITPAFVEKKRTPYLRIFKDE